MYTPVVEINHCAGAAGKKCLGDILKLGQRFKHPNGYLTKKNMNPVTENNSTI